VGEDQVVKIADFGISKMLSGSGQKLADAAGTPAFMAPELCDSRSEFSGQLADVWALGATMFMLRFGNPPFVAGNIMSLYFKILNEPLHFPHAINPSLQDLLENMLMKDPSKRYSLAQTMNHPWMVVPPAPGLSAMGEEKSIELSAQQRGARDAPTEMQAAGFQPPPSYDEEQRKAMEGPVTSEWI